MQGGENQVERTLYLQRTDSVRIPVSWCEVSAEKVAQDFETFEIDFFVNGNVVGEDKIGIGDYELDGLACRAWTIAVEKWPAGWHEVVAYWEFTEEIYETTLDITIPPSEIYQIFNVIVD
jgi:hypothetical protein